MPVEIEFQNFEVKANETHIGDIIRQYGFFLPSWVYKLTVEIYDSLRDDQPEGMIAWSKARPEYGHATICMLTSILDRPIKEQYSYIIHEILHIAHRREYNFVWDRLLSPVQDRNEDLHKFLVEDYREHNEEFIEHMTRCILQDEED